MQHMHSRQTYSLSARQVMLSERKEKKEEKKLRENEKDGGIAFPRQIGTGSLCGNRYERVTHATLRIWFT